MTHSEHTITVRRHYPGTSAHQAFRAWTEAEALRRWYAPVDGWIVGSASVVPGVGGSYAVSFGPPPEGDAYRESGCYTVFDPPHRLAWEGTLSGGEPQTIRVDVAFVEVDGGVEVVVAETARHDPEAAAEHEEGWTATLAHLAVVLSL